MYHLGLLDVSLQCDYARACMQKLVSLRPQLPTEKKWIFYELMSSYSNHLAVASELLSEDTFFSTIVHDLEEDFRSSDGDLQESIAVFLGILANKVTLLNALSFSY